MSVLLGGVLNGLPIAESILCEAMPRTGATWLVDGGEYTVMLAVLDCRDTSSLTCLSGVTGTSAPAISRGTLFGTGGVGIFQLSFEASRGLLFEKKDFALVVVRPKKSDRALCASRGIGSEMSYLLSWL